MKISFWIPATVLYAVSIAFSNSVQVGTVLFSTKDLGRRCWTENEKSLLRARLIMQDILPDPDCIDFSNPKTAVVLLDYFIACFEIINKFCYGKVQNLMNLALSDSLGGYLRSYVLPPTKRAYYAGQIRCSEAEKLFRLYNNIKIFLKTNGRGWAEPRKLSRRNFRVSPLVITGGSYEACKKLHVIEKNEKFNPICSLYATASPELENVQCTTTVTTVQPKNETVQPDKGSGENCTAADLQKPKEPNSTCPGQVQKPKKPNSTCPGQVQKSKEPNSTCPGQVQKPNLKEENDKEKGLPGKMKKLNFSSEMNLPVKNLVEILENESREPPEDSEIPKMKNNRCRRDGYLGQNDTNCLKRVVVPLPVLDDCQNPQSIAVPFRNRPFRNLHSASSAFILEYYYIAVIKCFMCTGNARTDIKKFNVEFHSWLVSQVLPHLNDEQWYPGFGGVLRIVETIKKFGVAPGFNEPSVQDTSYVFGKGVVFDVGDEKQGEDQPRNIIEECYPSTRRHVITAVLVVSLLWMFLFCACAFYSQATRGRSLLGGHSRLSSHTHSEPHLNSQSQIGPLPHAKPANSKTMSFQFFVKFFKNRKENEKDLCKDHGKQVYWNVIKLGNENRLEKESSEDKNHDETPLRKDLPPKLNDDPRIPTQSQGDFGFFRHEEFFKPNLPYCFPQYRFLKNKVKFVPGAQAESNQPQEEPDKVTLLWKKPSIKRNKKENRREYHNRILKEKNNSTSASYSSSYSASAEDAKNSTTKQSVCSCCSESCQQTSTSETNRSSQSQMKKVLTSTTVECFEDVKTKHRPFMKPFMKRVIMASTEESECDDQVSTSYEDSYED